MTSEGKSREFRKIAQPLGTLYALEAILAVTCFTLYKSSAPNTETTFSMINLMAILSAFASVLLFGYLLIRYRTAYRSLALAATISFVSLAFAFLAAEMVVRLVARSSDGGTTIANVTLRPTWAEVVDRSRTLIHSNTTYFVYDPDLGWIVGRNRVSADGMYASSMEGVRSAKPGIAFADMHASQRVALIGDSNAFSLEVPFEDSLGNRLGESLGDRVQVLNFGVDGYGIDQTYLRYERDVHAWKPNVVLIVFIQHDLMRTMAVYPFVSFGWAGYLVKPRFDLERDRLEIINRPLPGPDEILGAAGPGKLHHIEYDPGYVNSDWAWRFDRGPMLLRLLTSMSPPWPHQTARGNADTVALNAKLFQTMYASIERDGAKPFLVYLPQLTGDDTVARNTLVASGLPYSDMTDCVVRVPEDLRRVPSGHHYSGRGNQAIADCISPAIRCALASTCR
jgi:hypothetical protein